MPATTEAMPNSVQPLPLTMALPLSRTLVMTSLKSMSCTLECCSDRYSRSGMPWTEMCEVGMNEESPCSPMQMA